MGLIKAAVQAGKDLIAEQWLEYYYCETMSDDVLMMRAKHQVLKGENTKASENIISDGSGFAVNEGQALLIVEDGKVVDFTMEPGRFIWEQSSEPSLFHNGFKGLLESFKIFGKRIAYGGDISKDQRVYYVNIKENFGNKFGTQTPMPYHDPAYRGIYIRYFGQYTFKITDPIVFYANVAGNVVSTFTKAKLMEQCDAEFISALDSALAMCSDEGYQYNDLPKRQREISKFMNDTLDEEWHQRRGLQVANVAIMKVTPDDESRKRMQKIDDSIMMGDARVAAGRLADAQASALEKAAANDAGAFTGFLGMGMAMQQGAPLTDTMFQNVPQDQNNPLFAQRSMQKPTATASATWKCECGSENSGKFCSECGKPRPVSDIWICECGHENKGKFCSECGKARPQANAGFVCSNPACGYTCNEALKFCPECGSPRKV